MKSWTVEKTSKPHQNPDGSWDARCEATLLFEGNPVHHLTGIHGYRRLLEMAETWNESGYVPKSILEKRRIKKDTGTMALRLGLRPDMDRRKR